MKDDLENDAIRLETQLPRLMRYLFRHGVADPLADLSVAQLRMVRLLSGEPRVASELSEELGMTASAVSQTTHRLERMGLVQRAPDATDRRIRRIGLSEVGEQMMHARQQLRVNRAKSVLEGLPVENRQRLLASLDELFAEVGPSPKGTADPLPLVAEVEQELPPVPAFVPSERSK